MLPQKYIIAVLGDAYEGKTTTINKTFNKLAGSKIISGVTSVWGPLPSPSNVVDFSLTGITKYGLTGFLSQGDQICYTYVNLEKLVQMGCQVIVCACRKRNPDTFNAVAKVAWEYDFSIIWIKFDRPKDVSKTNIRMNYPTRYSTYSNSVIISASGCFAEKEPNDLLMVFSMNEV